MQTTQNILTKLLKLSICAVLTLGATCLAQDKKADPTGKWMWTVPGRNGGPDRTNTVTLKLDGEKVTGKVTSPTRDGTRDTDIEEGKLKGDEVSFTVTSDFNGNKMSRKYSGTVTADSIKGKIEFERNGEPQKRDWEAKKVTDKK